MISCETVEQVEAARDARDEWLRQYPGDYEIVQAGGSVENIADMLGMPTNQERLAAKRNELVKQMLSCRTVATVEAARDARDAWLLEHPGDSIVLQAGSGLERVAESLEMPTNQERLAAKRKSEE
jgi:hypothetical protein